MKHEMKLMKEMYARVFGSTEGQAVLDDLERIANQTRVAADSPNPYSAIFKDAQKQMVQRIRNMMTLTDTKHNIVKGNTNE